MPDAAVFAVPTLAALWAGVAAGQLDAAPALVVAVDRAQVDAHTTGLPVVAVIPHAPQDALIATN